MRKAAPAWKLCSLASTPPSGHLPDSPTMPSKSHFETQEARRTGSNVAPESMTISLQGPLFQFCNISI